MTAQAAAAALRLIPSDVQAMGVKVVGTDVRLVVQRSEAPETVEDIDDIVDELSMLLGPDVVVSERVELHNRPRLRPDDGVVWFYAARGD